MLRVVVVGLGPIGVGCARAAAAERDMTLVGLVDKDPSLAGMTLGELTGGEPDDGPQVAPLEDADLSNANVATVSTVSTFDRVAPTLRRLIENHLSVVTSCEQMLWPWYRHRELADEIDVAAREAGCALLGTGVNPGFLMDTMAVMLASLVRRARRVRCVRRVDVGLRRGPLLKKVGATLSPDEFSALAAAGKIGHAGLTESLALLANGLARTVEPGSIDTAIEPVIAETRIVTGACSVEPGQVAGVRNTATWHTKGLKIELDLTMAVGLDNTKDFVEIDGPVPIRMKIPGGVHGDSATIAMLLNQARMIHRVAPGLRTMLDMPPAGCRGFDG